MTTDPDATVRRAGAAAADGYLVSRKEAHLLASAAMFLVFVLAAAITGIGLAIGLPLSAGAWEWFWLVSIGLAGVAGPALVGWMAPDRTWAQATRLTAASVATAWTLNGIIFFAAALVLSEPCPWRSFLCFTLFDFYLVIWFVVLPLSLPLGLMFSLAIRRIRQNIEAGRRALQFSRRQRQ